MLHGRRIVGRKELLAKLLTDGGIDYSGFPVTTAILNIPAMIIVALVTTLLVVGILVAIALSDTVGRIRLQVFGFLGCAVGLVIATLSIEASGAARVYLIMAGVMLFNFMTNLGPNAQTYLLAGEVFPTEVRGMGAGFAAMIGKVGAVATTFGFPILLASLGTRTLLYSLAVTSVLGAIVTWVYRIETTGVNLDRIGRAPQESH